MNKKTFNLIAGITTGLATIGTAITVFIGGEYAVATSSVITIVEGAIIAITSKFVKE